MERGAPPVPVDHVVRFGCQKRPLGYRDPPAFLSDARLILDRPSVERIIRNGTRTTVVHRTEGTPVHDGRPVTVVLEKDRSALCGAGFELHAPASLLALPEDPEEASYAAMEAWLEINRMAEKWFVGVPHAPSVTPLVQRLLGLVDVATIAAAATGLVDAREVRFTPPSPLGPFRCLGLDAEGRATAIDPEMEARIGRGMPTAVALGRIEHGDPKIAVITLEAMRIDLPVNEIAPIDAIHALRNDPRLAAA